MAGKLIIYHGFKISMKDFNQENTNLQDNLNIGKFLKTFENAAINHYGQEIFNKWFKDLTILILNDHEVILRAPSKFVRDWVRREYIENKSSKFCDIILSIKNKVKKISIIHDDSQNAIKMGSKNNSIIANLSKHDNVFSFGTDLNNRYTFNSFVSCKYNKLALSMAKIASGLDIQTNLFDDKIPLFIHGGVGMGKTHLAQSIAWQLKENDKSKRIVYLSAEKFMFHFVKSIKSNDIMSFKEKMRSIDVLIVDDIQFIAGKESTQQEFMNCFNSLVEDNKQVVLVCDRDPSALENIDEKLKSRISGGMVINFKNPDFNDRLTILKEKACSLGQEISEEVINFIAQHVKTSVRDLEGALKKLIAEKLFLDEEITIQNTQKILNQYIVKSNSESPTISKIQKIVANFYNIKISDLSSSSRLRSISRPRQIAMYLSKNHTQESFPKIGEKFGGKNHATVIHSCKTIEKLLIKDLNLCNEIRNIEDKING